jgi:hypothetical protein
MTTDGFGACPAVFRSPAGEIHGEVTLVVADRAPGEILRPNGDHYDVYRLTENLLPELLIYDFVGTEPRSGS